MTDKPVKKTLVYYNYYDALHYLEEEYPSEHWKEFTYNVVDHVNEVFFNDTYITIKEKYNRFPLFLARHFFLLLDEFGTGFIGEREANFWISW